MFQCSSVPVPMFQCSNDSLPSVPVFLCSNVGSETVATFSIGGRKQRGSSVASCAGWGQDLNEWDMTTSGYALLRAANSLQRGLIPQNRGGWGGFSK